MLSNNHDLPAALFKSSNNLSFKSESPPVSEARTKGNSAEITKICLRPADRVITKNKCSKHTTCQKSVAWFSGDNFCGYSFSETLRKLLAIKHLSLIGVAGVSGRPG